MALHDGRHDWNCDVFFFFTFSSLLTFTNLFWFFPYFLFDVILKDKLNTENEDLKRRLESSNDRLNSQTDENEKLMRALNARTDSLQNELNDVRRSLEMYVMLFPTFKMQYIQRCQNWIKLFFFVLDFRSETQEKIKALLKNAEISQSEERLKQELRNESHEASELFETTQSLQETLRMNEANVEQLNSRIKELDEQLRQQHVNIDRMDDLKREIHEKNKVRLAFAAF